VESVERTLRRRVRRGFTLYGLLVVAIALVLLATIVVSYVYIVSDGVAPD
jgi:Tfp pilus assembly protein PilE